MNYAVVPGAIFTMPEVATVGLSEAQARAQGVPIHTDTVLFRNLGKAQVIGDFAGEASSLFMLIREGFWGSIWGPSCYRPDCRRGPCRHAGGYGSRVGGDHSCPPDPC